MGKTSLLNVLTGNIKETLHGEVLPIRLDVDRSLSSEGDPLDLFRGLELEILHELGERDPSIFSYVSALMRKLVGVETEALATPSNVKLDLGLPDFASVSWERVVQKGRNTPLSLVLKSDFKKLAERAKGQGLRAVVLMIDDAKYIPELKSSETILQLLRNTFQSQSGYSIMIAGDVDTLERISALHKGFASLFERIPLYEFDVHDAVELVEKRLNWTRAVAVPVEFDSSALQELGHSELRPGTIVRNCAAATEVAQRRGTYVTGPLLKEVIDS